MAKPQLGQLHILSSRELWKHEERDFTPWLADNIDQLSAVLQVPIVVDQIEQRIGTYELDILGRVEETDAVVIVENQLGPTDHSHLGQVITYASGLDAAIIIWIATEVRDEHRSAVEWLNIHTDDKVSFFLARPEVFRIDESLPAVRFYIEAAPNEFGRRLKSVIEKEDRPSHEFRRRFWESLLLYLSSHGHTWAKGRGTTKDSWVSSPVGRGGISVNMSMAHESRMRVEIYCANDADKILFERLLAHRGEVEAKLTGETVCWERLEDAAASRIAVYRAYDKQLVNDDSPARMDLFAWVSTNMAIFRGIPKEFLVEKQDG